MDEMTMDVSMFAAFIGIEDQSNGHDLYCRYKAS